MDKEYRTTNLSSEQEEDYIAKMILLILKEKKVSLSQARGIFEYILHLVEDKNPISL